MDKKNKKDKGMKKKVSIAKNCDLPQATFGVTSEASATKKNKKAKVSNQKENDPSKKVKGKKHKENNGV